MSESSDLYTYELDRLKAELSATKEKLEFVSGLLQEEQRETQSIRAAHNTAWREREEYLYAKNSIGAKLDAAICRAEAAEKRIRHSEVQQPILEIEVRDNDTRITWSEANQLPIGLWPMFIQPPIPPELAELQLTADKDAEITRLNADLDERAALLLESTKAGCALTDEVARLNALVAMQAHE